MKKRVDVRKPRMRPIILTVVAILFVGFIILPLSLSAIGSNLTGNVALIPIEGVIMGSSGSAGFGVAAISSQDIVKFIQEADENPSVEVILLEINSPGGSAVASDEIAEAVKKSEKPVVSLIREVGASGGYWVASATEHIMANRMSITGSIGVISSYLEFSGLMEDYGVGYERLIAGKNKDLGTPFKKLTPEEKAILQGKLNKIHDYFITEVAENRGLSNEKVREVATGEFYLGVEAKNFGLIDDLGNKYDMEKYLQETYDLKKVTYANYEIKKGFLGSFAGTTSDFFFRIGEGIGTALTRQDNGLLRI
jgi:protease IV